MNPIIIDAKKFVYIHDIMVSCYAGCASIYAYYFISKKYTYLVMPGVHLFTHIII